jgi:hypothetical protein
MRQLSMFNQDNTNLFSHCLKKMHWNNLQIPLLRRLPAMPGEADCQPGPTRTTIGEDISDTSLLRASSHYKMTKTIL